MLFGSIFLYSPLSWHIFVELNIDLVGCSTKAATRRVLLKKFSLEILQNSQENNCARASFLITNPKLFSPIALIFDRNMEKLLETFTAWKMSKYGDFSGPHFHVFTPNAGK